MEKRKPIAPVLKEMNLYDYEVFSLDNYMSINAAISSVQTEKQMKFTRKRDNETRTLKVTRIA